MTSLMQEKLDDVIQSPREMFDPTPMEKLSLGTENGGEASRSTESLQFDECTLSAKKVYRDFSRVPPAKSEGASSPQISNTLKEPTFPVKLHMILSSPEFQDIISWLPHGRCWRILQQRAFEERVIPLFFRHGRYSSFARQVSKENSKIILGSCHCTLTYSFSKVNGWGFRRVTHGCDYNSYYHEVSTSKDIH